jgi:hypothetical protein
VDETLQQITKKLSDVKTLIQFCISLRKLRLVRRQHARDKNAYSKDYDESEEVFEDSIKELETIIMNQKLIYENEKNNLICKVYLLLFKK